LYSLYGVFWSGFSWVKATCSTLKIKRDCLYILCFFCVEFRSVLLLKGPKMFLIFGGAAVLDATARPIKIAVIIVVATNLIFLD